MSTLHTQHYTEIIENKYICQNPFTCLSEAVLKIAIKSFYFPSHTGLRASVLSPVHFAQITALNFGLRDKGLYDKIKANYTFKEVIL